MITIPIKVINYNCNYCLDFVQVMGQKHRSKIFSEAQHLDYHTNHLKSLSNADICCSLSIVSKRCEMLCWSFQKVIVIW